MGLFDSVVHTVQHAVDQVSRPVSGLFSGHNALARALVNPGDAVAVGQVLGNNIAGQSPKKQAADTNATAKHVATQSAHQYGWAHQQLFNNITDGLHWIGHAIVRVYHSVWDQVARTWASVGGKRVGNKLGDNIHSTIQKWGGERRVMGWIIFGIGVIIYILVEFFSWGAATPAATAGLLALATMCVSYGASQGLTPDAKAMPVSMFSESTTVDNSKLTTITDLGGSSGGAQSGSTVQGFLDSLGLGGLPPVAVVGVAVAGMAGLYFLLRR